MSMDEELAQALADVAMSMRGIATWMDAERKLVRDGNGRVVGVDRRMPPAITHNPKKVTDIDDAVEELTDALDKLLESVASERELVQGKDGKIAGSRRKQGR